MKKTHLSNGIPVFLVPSSGTEAATVLVMVKVGSRYETPALNGVSHFIEHMLFKGTPRRKTPQDISRTLDAVGADYNAFTAKDETGYWVKVNRTHVPLAVDLLHDMLTSSKFSAPELARERHVIMEEINMYHDNPMMHVDEMLESVMFAGSTLGWEIAGTHKTMTEMPRADVMAFWRRAYQPRRMVIAVAGAFPKDTKARLEKSFGRKLTAPADMTYDPFLGFLTSRRPRVAIQYKETKQVQVAVGFPGVSHMDRRADAIRLLATILGGPMSSRLFTSVREKRGLCYFVRASHASFEDTGLFMVQSGLDRGRLGLAGKIIMQELRKMVKERVGGAELTRAKEYLAGKTILALEDSSTVAEWYAKQELHTGTVLTPHEKLARLRKVTPAQIQDAAAWALDTRRMGLAGIGPFRREGELSKYFL
ncbi:insulinase family protein [Candidatus Uhrbacteria bacterium]|nr:insulinase family protein [Candidatus Uhrbacteria bacterium]